jgi:hypothetical protein
MLPSEGGRKKGQAEHVCVRTQRKLELDCGVTVSGLHAAPAWQPPADVMGSAWPCWWVGRDRVPGPALGVQQSPVTLDQRCSPGSFHDRQSSKGFFTLPLHPISLRSCPRNCLFNTYYMPGDFITTLSLNPPQYPDLSQVKKQAQRDQVTCLSLHSV